MPDAGDDDPDEDETLWRAVAATVWPFPGRLLVPGPPPALRLARRAVPVRQISGDVPATRPFPAEMVPGLDGRTEDRLRRGLLPLDGRLDLHGLTQDAAHRRLRDFIRRGHAGGRRCLLVITGKGAAHGEGPWYVPAKGVLRASLAGWLGAPDIAPLVLRIQPAQPRHGGDGAFYVLLRRRRD